MFRYLADTILLVIICLIPYFFSRLRLGSSRSREAMYEFARDKESCLFSVTQLKRQKGIKNANSQTW
jgi:hypothetical protein